MYYRNLEDFKKATGHEINGCWYPRVTSIISIKAKPALLKFYGDGKNYNSVLATVEKSASEGTMIHEAVESILKGQVPVLTDLVKPAVSAFKDFLQMHRINIEEGEVEKPIWSQRHKFSGTIDILGEVDGEFGVLDIKTSSGIWRDYNLQTSAYVGALLEDEPWASLPRKEAKNRWILRLDQQQHCQICGAKRRNKGGNQKIKGGVQSCFHEWSEMIGEWELKKLENFESDFEAFLAAKKLWEWENEEWLRQIK